MIEKVYEIVQPTGEKDVESYLPIYLDTPSEHISSHGTCLGIFNEKGLRHFIIHEILNGIFYIHNVMMIGEHFLPISTRMRDRFGAIKKIYTSGVLDVLIIGEERGVARYGELPASPASAAYGIIQQGITSNWIKGLGDETYRQVENTLCGHDIQNELYNYSHYKDGYVVSDSIMTNIKQFSETLKNTMIYNPSEPDFETNLTKLVEIYSALENHMYLREDQVAIHKPRLIKDLIAKKGIYYYNVYTHVPFSILGSSFFSSVHPYHKREYAGQVAQITQNFDLPILEILRFVDCFLPQEFEVSFIGNECLGFQHVDELWDMWIGVCNLCQLSYYEHHMSTRQKLDFNVFMVLRTLNSFFGILFRQPAKIDVTKTNETSITIKIFTKKKYFTQSWDMTMVDLAAPEQYLDII